MPQLQEAFLEQTGLENAPLQSQQGMPLAPLAASQAGWVLECRIAMVRNDDALAAQDGWNNKLRGDIELNSSFSTPCSAFGHFRLFAIQSECGPTGGWCGRIAYSFFAGSFFVPRKFQITWLALKSSLVLPTAFFGSYCSPPGQVLPAPLTL